MPADKKLITDEYREILTKEHKESRAWGTSGHRHLMKYHKFLDEHCRHLLNGNTTMLDYGCGKATIAIGLPFSQNKIHFYDPAIEKRSEDPPRCDVVLCTDVLEHIEPELLDNVLEHICEKTRRIAFIYIHLLPAVKILEDGRNAHLIVEDELWWYEKLNKHFYVLEMTHGSRRSGVYFGLIPWRNVPGGRK